MKEKFKNIRTRFKQLINEKNNLKGRRNNSFIDINYNYEIKPKDNNYNDEFNLTKNNINVENKNNDFKMNSILDKKFNILKQSLEKIQLLIENNINKENQNTNNIINKIQNINNNYMNELLNDGIRIKNDLKNIQKEYSKDIKKQESNQLDSDIEVNDLINEITKETKKQIYEPMDKINFFKNNQQKYFEDINNKIKENFEDINNSCNNDIEYSNQKFNIIMNDINSFNNQVYMLDNEENVNRENFRKSINDILNIEIDNLKSGELVKSIDFYKKEKSS